MPTLPGIDAVLVERARRSRELGQQHVAVVVEVADERRLEPASSMRCLISGTAAAASGTLTVMRTISEPASASSMHCCAVARDVGGVGVRHRLDDDGRTAAHLNVTDLHAHRRVARPDCHEANLPEGRDGKGRAAKLFGCLEILARRAERTPLRGGFRPAGCSAGRGRGCADLTIGCSEDLADKSGGG